MSKHQENFQKWMDRRDWMQRMETFAKSKNHEIPILEKVAHQLLEDLIALQAASQHLEIPTRAELGTVNIASIPGVPARIQNMETMKLTKFMYEQYRAWYQYDYPEERSRVFHTLAKHQTLKKYVFDLSTVKEHTEAELTRLADTVSMLLQQEVRQDAATIFLNTMRKNTSGL